jgi:hypothetical protein
MFEITRDHSDMKSTPEKPVHYTRIPIETLTPTTR